MRNDTNIKGLKHVYSIMVSFPIPLSAETCPTPASQLKSSGRYVLLSCDVWRWTCLSRRGDKGKFKKTLLSVGVLSPVVRYPNDRCSRCRAHPASLTLRPRPPSTKPNYSTGAAPPPRQMLDTLCIVRDIRQ
jgi:hypothetical protein